MTRQKGLGYRGTVNLQSSQHVSRRDAIDADANVSPLHSKRRSHVADSSLGAVVRSVKKKKREIVSMRHVSMFSHSSFVCLRRGFWRQADHYR